ncbi:MAG: bifunctional (p)ppGpp synthetase/guanosine-3',5'-bis(diphosphate) 3'-pyrophosphohydrolase [Sulfuriferula multivorans]|uniref:Bifunctional (P)ppGpp synthetase/guanosine-3',5'-bis(Diphosphate) 3'-pyrophosphohydrolase n=1 Tax=Sulfuriferula multivorans TaxID=1559896 RepID=A0A7C9TBR5_9PROT|nr:bifunctional (p)ppGpp synthetase/guanosine-3',5'-bis(diphosphate) 3'-pyrophosphohydrolase [Sulfuriferula multivorans]
MTHAFDSLRPVLSYLSADEINVVEEAYEFSRSAHEGQFRKSGEPYISHPLAVAGILAGWHLDAQTLSAALLHDVVEDTPATAGEIEVRFGKSVAMLVEGVSKLDKLSFASEQHAQAENFRKMLLAMAQDVRVILIKLADRTHNMHTLDAMPVDKRRRIAAETLEIYAPIANRLGLHTVYQELEDLGFRYSHPNRYQVLAKAVKAARGNRRELVDKVKVVMQEKLDQAKVDATITGREKHLFSIYRKMQEKNLAFSEVFDIYGFRVVLHDLSSCYVALGVLHALYKPIPGKFKDYIAIPKANGYQSLHSILFGPSGTPIEVQIRTTDMNRLAESGIASHWMYKSSDAVLNDVQTRTHRWLQSLLDIQADHGDSTEFLEHIKIDLFPDEVYVFTPKGKIMALPRGATAVDFAFAVHTDVGHRCIAVKINYELMPLRTQLRNGDHVEVVTASNASPNAAWLNFVVTGKARSHIRNYLRNTGVEEAAALGERLLNRAIAALHPDAIEPDESVWDRLVKEYGVQTRQELFAGIGLGRKLPLVVAHQLLHVLGQKTGEPAHPHAISIRGTEGIAVELAQCCHPIPGDPILGFIHKDRGLIIHTHDCPSIRAFRTDPDKWLDVEWEAEPGHMFDVLIKVVVGNQRGVLAKVASAIAEHDSNIGNVSMEEEDGSPYTILFFTVEVENRMHLARVMRGLRTQPDVVRIYRVKGKKDGRAAPIQ